MPTTLTTAFAANPLTAAIIERYMYATVLSVPEKKAVFWKLGRMVAIPASESKTITFERFERINPPRETLQEGVTPSGSALVVSKVTAIAEQWGDFVTLTDVAELTVRHQPFQRALELLGLQMAETVDREVQRVLLAGSNLFFPNDRADRTALLTTDVPATPLLRKVMARLRNNGAPPYEGNRHVGVCDPSNSQDIQGDATFVPAAQYSNLTALQEAELGTWMNARWMESNHIPVQIRDTAVIATVTGGSNGAVAPSGDTALDNATYTVRLVSTDSQGFETGYGLAAAGVATVAQVFAFTTPALPTGQTSFSIYVQKGTGAFTLQKRNAAACTLYRLSGDGNGTNGITYTSTGVVAQVIPPAGVSVHQMYVFGKEYYSCCELAAAKVLRTPAGPQKGDELDQRRSVGWKAFFKSVITNENYGARIECSSNN